MNVKIEISGLEDFMSDVEKANSLLAELGQLLNGIRAKYISVTASTAMTEMESKDIDINTVNTEQDHMECQVIFGAILDGEIYEKHRDFFENYTFSNDLFNKLSEALREFYADNRAEDIKAFAQFFIDKYQADRSRVCVMLAEGMSSVKSLTAVERYMDRLMESKSS